jgi:hypothetical protein
MKRFQLFLAAMISVLCFSPTRAQETHPHTHTHAPAEKLGLVNFPVSCNASAQKQFNRATALLTLFGMRKLKKLLPQLPGMTPSVSWPTGVWP